MMNLFSKLSTWYFSRKALPYWSIILLDCLVILFSGLLVYALNNGIFATMDIFLAPVAHVGCLPSALSGGL